MTCHSSTGRLDSICVEGMVQQYMRKSQLRNSKGIQQGKYSATGCHGTMFFRPSSFASQTFVCYALFEIAIHLLAISLDAIIWAVKRLLSFVVYLFFAVFVIFERFSRSIFVLVCAFCLSGHNIRYILRDCCRARIVFLLLLYLIVLLLFLQYIISNKKPPVSQDRRFSL